MISVYRFIMMNVSKSNYRTDNVKLMRPLLDESVVKSSDLNFLAGFKNGKDLKNVNK